MIIVIGHKNPDTDSVVSAIVWSKLLQKEEKEAIPAVTGEINNETKYVLSEAGVEVPVIKEKLRGEDVFLVDHHSKNQMIEGGIVVGVLDHHHLSGLITDSPIYFRNEPLGSTSTLIFKITKERGISIDKEDALLLLGGIISDTLKFTSPSSTFEDEEAAKEVSKIAERDIDDLAKSMFKEKSDFSEMDMREVIRKDYKEFSFSNKKVGIGVCETTDKSFFEGKDKGIIEEMKNIKQEENLDFVFFAVIDILESNSFLYTSTTEEMEVAKRAFKINSSNNPALLEGVTSRKKQIVPPLSEVFKQI